MPENSNFDEIYRNSNLRIDLVNLLRTCDEITAEKKRDLIYFDDVFEKTPMGVDRSKVQSELNYAVRYNLLAKVPATRIVMDNQSKRMVYMSSDTFYKISKEGKRVLRDSG